MYCNKNMVVVGYHLLAATQKAALDMHGFINIYKNMIWSDMVSAFEHGYSGHVHLEQGMKMYMLLLLPPGVSALVNLCSHR